MEKADSALIFASVLAIAASATLSGCSRKYVKHGEVVDVIEQSMVTRKYIQSIGIGAGDPALKTLTQRRATARNAAIVSAQYEMLSLVKGVEIEGGITVSRAMETNSLLTSRVQDVVRGAEIVSTRFTNDGGAVVVLRLPRKRLKRLEGIKFK